MISGKITRKGQVTIPASYRDKLGLHEGEKVLFHEEDGKVVIERARDWAERTAGIFAKYAKNVPPLSADTENRWFEEGVAEEVGASLKAESNV